ncbi:glycoside hydrolase family 3 N-terminal domain-containing protein [Lentisphaera profundi]|uniref:Glycoside hydrolase family 3 N-terminal domain-containing protein n=1 Tax=Lentisphaera profundi TaxID=1658616 RepID=A0ABY7VNC1_9BACT|nr:glycoside hydrolase family 3 N-terminal domain-containing protein [Lentisphaera profundi]WDE95387.1 glycoside hydrolase family 3 N-terminal domain-containing protein [Lentisphaera profundi]
MSFLLSSKRELQTQISQMTLREKVGQMNQVIVSHENIENLIAGGDVGSVIIINEEDIARSVKQKELCESHSEIPLLVSTDVIHGYHTIFPIPLACSSTWNPALIKAVAEFSACESSADSTDWIFAPMVDVSRDLRWGRIAESSGEDTYLNSVFSEAWVEGIQKVGTAACVKHFAGYGAAEGGRDYNSAQISERALREVYLPPFKAALDAGCKTIMMAFQDLNGIPASIHPLLYKILREEWGFEGVIISDYNAILELVDHGVAENLKEAAYLAIQAGIDVDMMSNAYSDHLVDLVNEGRVEEGLIDASVERILKLKQDILIEKVSPSKKEGEKLALQSALESCVLLKNEQNSLPLGNQIESIALIGELAEDAATLLGTWSFLGQAEKTESIRKALEISFYTTAILYESGENLEETLAVASTCEKVVLIIGEEATMSGEAHSRSEPNIPQQQMKLLKALHEGGKEVIAVVLSGRPLILTEAEPYCKAILLAWHGGTLAGRAIAEILKGDFNPSGRLTCSFPRSVGQVPLNYNHRNTGRPVLGQGITQFSEAYKSNYIDQTNEALYPFGFGLTYSTVEYSDLQLSKTHLEKSEHLFIEVSLENKSDRACSEIVQLYIRDLVAQTARPVKELKAFEKVSLEAGEKRCVSLTLSMTDLAYYNWSNEPQVDSGDFNIWVGPSSKASLQSSFAIV